LVGWLVGLLDNARGLEHTRKIATVVFYIPCYFGIHGLKYLFLATM